MPNSSLANKIKHIQQQTIKIKKSGPSPILCQNQQSTLSSDCRAWKRVVINMSAVRLWSILVYNAEASLPLQSHFFSLLNHQTIQLLKGNKGFDLEVGLKKDIKFY